MPRIPPPTAPYRAAFPRALTALATGLLLVVAAGGAPSVLAQDAPPPAQQDAAQLLSAEQLDQLVAPIALYPDNLLGQILTASTYPLEDVMAARWCSANSHTKGQQLEDAMAQQPWDPSVKALTAVPQVLAMMNDKLDWTQQLGDAYLAQPDDVATAVQRLRLKAQAAGNLQASSQERIQRVPAPQPIIIDGTPQPDYIAIEPVDPGVIYVPVYNPVAVFGPWGYPAYPPFYWYPPGYAAVGVIGFGAPFVVGAALWAHYDWTSHRVDVDVANYNRFNHTHLDNSAANQTWQHDPSHRGNIPYNNAALQEKFGKAASSNASVNPAANPNNLRGGINPVTNNKTITNINNGGTNRNDLKLEKNGKLENGTNPTNLKGGAAPGNNKADLKLENGNGNKPGPKLDRRVNVETGNKGGNNAAVHTNQTNAVIHNPGSSNNNVNRSVQNVVRNPPPPPKPPATKPPATKPPANNPKEKKQP